jgi:hypothetical protein
MSRHCSFAPFLPATLAQLRWYLDAPFHILTFPVGIELSALAALAWIFGCIALWRINRGLLLVLTFPAVLTLFASALHKYPFQGRLLLFLVPLILMCIGEGTTAMIEAAKQAMPPFRIVFLTLLFLHPSFEAAYHLAVPRKKQEVKRLIPQLKNRFRKGDTLYVYRGTRGIFSYYYHLERLHHIEPIFGAPIKPGSWFSVMEEVDKLQGRSRVWFLFSNVNHAERVEIEEVFIACLNRVGKKLESFQDKGASLYLYDLRPGGVADREAMMGTTAPVGPCHWEDGLPAGA